MNRPDTALASRQSPTSVWCCVHLWRPGMHGKVNRSCSTDKLATGSRASSRAQATMLASAASTHHAPMCITLEQNCTPNRGIREKMPPRGRHVARGAASFPVSSVRGAILFQYSAASSLCGITTLLTHLTTSEALYSVSKWKPSVQCSHCPLDFQKV